MMGIFMKKWFCLALLFTTSGLGFAQASDNIKTLSTTHNARYCEVLVIKRHFSELNASVYNSLNLDTCPADLWNKLNISAIKKQFDASEVKLNGPRYFVMDGLIASNGTVSAPIVTIGGIKFQKRAEISTTIWNGLGTQLYAPTKVQRHTVWIYNPGTMIYKLIAPNHDVYVMQSYAQIVDPHLQLADLPNLGSRLKLPQGWSYQTQVLTQPLKLTANGIAYVLQDDLRDSYQKE